MNRALPIIICFFISSSAFADAYQCDMLLSKNRTSYIYKPGLSFGQKLDVVHSQWNTTISSYSLDAATKVLLLQESLTFVSMVRVAHINFLAERSLSIPSTQALLKAFEGRNVSVDTLFLPALRKRIENIKSTFARTADWSEQIIKELAVIYLHFPFNTGKTFRYDLQAVDWILSHVSAGVTHLSVLQAARVYATVHAAKWRLHEMPERFERVRIQLMNTNEHQTIEDVLQSTDEVITILELLASQIRSPK